MAIPLTSVLTAEIQMKGQMASGGSNAINTNFVFHYKRTGTAVAPTKSALATAFQAGPGAAIVAALNNRWSESAVEVRWIDDALDQSFPFANVNVGAVAGDSMPSDQAAYLLFRTGIKGRSYRGSKHLGPLSESNTTAGTDDILNAAAITLFTTVATACAANLVDATPNTWVPVVFSRTLSQTRQNPTTIIVNAVSAILLNKRVGTMRRRKAKSAY